MPRPIRPGPAAVLLAALSGPVAAQDAAGEDARQLVEGCQQSESVILRIEACTRLIEAERPEEDNPAWAFSNRALAYEAVGRPSRALSDYNTALLLDPGFAVGYNNRGNLHARLGDLDAAIADHTEAVEIDPDYVDAWFNLAADYEEAGEPEAAVEAYGAALEADPDYVDALTARAALLCRMGRVDASVEDRLALLEKGQFSATELQEFLQARGYYEAAIDGIFGRGSRAALRDWTEAGCPRE